MSAATIAAFAGAAVLVIGAIFGGIASVVTVWRTIVTVAKDTEAIKGHVNSEKTAAEGRETALKQENALLREMIAEKKQTAALLAQARISNAPVVTAPALVVPVDKEP